MLARLQQFLGQFWLLLTALAYLCGAAAIAIGVNAAGKRADQGPGQGGWAGPIAWMASGAALMAMPALLNALSNSLIGSNWDSVGPEIFSTAPNLLEAFDGHATQETIIGILRIVQFLGGIAIFRGVILLNAAAQPGQQQGLGAGLTHVIGGALALNIGDVLRLLNDLAAPA